MNEVLKKLQYRHQDPVLVLSVPDEAASLISAIIAEGPRVDRAVRGEYGWVVAFATTMKEARSVADEVATAIEGDGVFWLCYPKGTSKRYPKPDLNRDSLWPLLETAGFRPVAQVAIDPDWSAMRFRKAEFVKPTTGA